MKEQTKYNWLKMATCFAGFLLFVQMIAAKTPFEQANAFYQEKQYEKAAAAYHQLIRKGEQNNTVYFNLGNTYYRLKQFPKAVLYFEKALKQDPGNDKIEHNLKMANNKALSKIESSSRFFVIQYASGFIREFSARTWAVIFLVWLWISIAAFLAGFRQNPGSGSFYRNTGIVAGLLAVLFFVIAKQRYTEQTSYTHAVVLQAGAELKAEPVAGSKTKTAIEAGSKVGLLDRDANWYRVELPNGKQGWIDSNAIIKI